MPVLGICVSKMDKPLFRSIQKLEKEQITNLTDKRSDISTILQIVKMIIRTFYKNLYVKQINDLK